jgi:selenocysteine lyase/cysteine desulfurase
MITTWKQRERRNGIVLKQVPIPVPCEDPLEIVRRFEAGITAKTRVIHMCHVINLTGQILPVRLVVQMARAKGIPVIVDGAHSFAHLDFKHADLDCDYYGTSLHKFLFAPHGTGMLFVRKSKIPELWPLMPAPPEMDADIRKFEEIGTHPAANFLAIADALIFHAGIGPARKEARLLYLRDRWAKRLAGQDRFRLHTSLKPGFATGVANVEIDGIDAGKLSDHLWEKDRIFTVAIKHENFQGIRVSPAVYTTLAEVDRFGDAMERVAKNGLPA